MTFSTKPTYSGLLTQARRAASAQDRTFGRPIRLWCAATGMNTSAEIAAPGLLFHAGSTAMVATTLSVAAMQIRGEAPDEVLHRKIIGHDLKVQMAHAATPCLVEHQTHHRSAKAAPSPFAFDAESQFSPRGIICVGQKFAGRRVSRLGSRRR